VAVAPRRPTQSWGKAAAARHGRGRRPEPVDKEQQNGPANHRPYQKTMEKQHISMHHAALDFSFLPYICKQKTLE
jgi:hypothetical protein